MDDKKQIDVRIADFAPIPILVSEYEVEAVHAAEDNVTHLWKVWKKRYGKEKSPIEIMAMVAFQFAKLYYTKEELESDMIKILTDFEKALDSHLLKTE
ncbi:MAG: cell division protein ZapA [Bacteroidales bacterium]|nr:cell division protein ZapA [Bacteroidales bacterium]